MFLQSELLQEDLKNNGKKIVHGFFTSQGGVSSGVYASLNCGLYSQDDEANVRNNLEIVRSLLQQNNKIPFLLPEQKHTSLAHIVKRPWSDLFRPFADSLITEKKDMMMCVLTADCAPIFLWDLKLDIIAVVHAGWRGSVTGVVREAVNKMYFLGAQDVHACIGPCLHQEHCEMGDMFLEAFHFKESKEKYLKPSPKNAKKVLFDLPGFLEGRLYRAGVKKVEILQEDTYSQPDKFFSYRRNVHAGKELYGRQISVIGVLS